MFSGLRQFAAASRNPFDLHFSAGWLQLSIYLNGNLIDPTTAQSARAGKDGKIVFFVYDMAGEMVFEQPRKPATRETAGPVVITSTHALPCSGCVQSRRKAREWWLM